MADTIKTVIMIGASGSIGGSIFKALVDSGKFEVSVLSRPESTNTYASGIKVIKSDYSEKSLVDAFKGQDAVVCALGAAGLAESPKIIDACVLAGVKRYIPAEYGSNTQNSKATTLIPFFGLKVGFIEQLKKQESKGLTWTAIPSGAAFDWGCQIGLTGFNINTHEALIMDDGNRAFSVFNLSQIGHAVVAVLSKPAETANKFIYVHSFTVSQNEILAEFEKVSGKKWEVTHSTTEAAAKEGGELLSKGDFSGLLLLLKANFMGEGYGSNYVTDVENGNALLGLPDQSLEKSVASVVSGKWLS